MMFPTHAISWTLFSRGLWSPCGQGNWGRRTWASAWEIGNQPSTTVLFNHSPQCRGQPAREFSDAGLWIYVHFAWALRDLRSLWKVGALLDRRHLDHLQSRLKGCNLGHATFPGSRMGSTELFAGSVTVWTSCLQQYSSLRWRRTLSKLRTYWKGLLMRVECTVCSKKERRRICRRCPSGAGPPSGAPYNVHYSTIKYAQKKFRCGHQRTKLRSLQA